MAASKKQRNKKYRPRPVNSVAAFAAIDLVHAEAYAAEVAQRPLSDGQITDLGVGYRLAFDDMTQGRASADKWAPVAGALNIAAMLADMGIGDEYQSWIGAALDGAFRAKVRADKTGLWGFDGDAITAIKNGLEVHDSQIEIATQDEMRRAVAEVYARIEAGEHYTETM
jgi:hypothetical protein